MKGENKEYEICKPVFISIHGIGRSRTEYVVDKFRKAQVVPSKDKRGKHGDHVKKYTEDVNENVKTFINRILRHESHSEG